MMRNVILVNDLIAEIYFLLIISIYSLIHVGYENHDINHCVIIGNPSSLCVTRDII